MARVCFVLPADEFDRDFIQLSVDVAIAAAVLRADGHEITVWDRRVGTGRPTGGVDGFVVITAVVDRAQCYPLELHPVREAVADATALAPRAWTVACGPHPTHLPEATRAELGVGHVSRGETDAAAVAAVRALVRHGSATPAVLPEQGVHPDLAYDETPPPAHDLFPLDRYEAEVIVDGRLRRGTCGLVLAARGCTYQCTFCHLPHGSRMRPQPVDRVLAEVDSLRRHGSDSIFFLDYVFGLQRDFYSALCAGLRDRDIGWTGQTRAEVVLRSDPAEWAAAGCRGMWLGAESPDVAHTGVRKRVSEAQIREAVLKLRDAGIVPFAFVLLGLPDDDACASGRLADWAAGLPGWFGTNQLYLRPGTPLYDELAPGLNGGVAPRTWAEVAAVTRRYREEYPCDLGELEARLRRLPNHVSQVMAHTGAA
ncbi:B12-binding domain-containing radical SAM protein [Couchioplanes caeruleus]|uniref:Radical SAM protein n=2 Tax=Couchioplanes caeruleus TaxID=56438 RepID=A0A1K0GMU5_9ACTN|nr:radical SAM protein [Couchioplanes caeruleus]OJF12396.1 radical SAM protein [Couchioplanes caeruleus subsp. caeruleus]ROP29500.1 radical SAM superfamily enzyme YgiQ (UPF0313 family) [Couchioplanes caeruleus]